MTSSSDIPEVLDGRYRILSLLGEGGMGKVYEAEHVDIGKRVAVKVLHRIFSSDEAAVDRFRREARAASKIGHPNIVEVTDSGNTPDGAVYFVMEHLEGEELAGLMASVGRLSVGRSLAIAAQVCRALSAAHKVGIIHRDLKPENIFLVVRESVVDFVKVLDFGIAKSVDLEEDARLTQPGIAMGTPQYMAPEQAMGQPVDARSDIFALGAVLYEMVTGHAIVSGKNFMEILSKRASQDPKPPRELVPDISEDVEGLLMKALAREPADRFQSMSAFGYAITKSHAGRGKAVEGAVGIAMSPEVMTTLESRPIVTEPAPAAADSTASANGGVSNEAVGGLEDDGFSVDPGSAAVPDSEPPRRRRRGLRLLLLAGLMAAAAGVYWVEQRDQQTASVAPGRADAPTTIAATETEPDTTEPDAGPSAPSVDADVPGPVPRQEAAPARGLPALNWKKVRATKNLWEAKKFTQRANKALGNKNYAQAQALFARVAKGRRNKDWGYIGLAKVSLRTGDHDGALNFARKGLQSGGGARARLVMADAYVVTKNFAKAIKQYRLVLKADRRNRHARRGLAAAQRAAKRK